MKLIILSGVAGTGKSTYVRENYPNAVVVSSDEIGKNSGLKSNENWVFTEMYEKVNEAMSQQKETIIVDATMLTRRKRATVLNQTRPDKKGYTVEVIQLHKPLEQIIEQNKNRPEDDYVPESKVRQMYTAMQPPKVGLDCDSYKIISPGIKAYTNEMNKGVDEPHHSPYHNETLREHMQMTVEKSQEKNDENLVELAKYHDLGKAVTRTSKELGPLARQFAAYYYGGHDTYNGHANVSAMYYHISKGKDVNVDISDAILHHMNAHNSENIAENKAVKRENVSSQTIELLETFRVIDSESKVSDDLIRDAYEDLRALDYEVEKYKKEPTEESSLLIKLLANENIRVSLNVEDITNPLFTFKYAHSGVDFTNSLVRNARGLTLNRESEIVTIGFEKFFNYKQLEEYEQYDETFKETYSHVSPTDKYTVWEKLDGTFIALGVNNDKFIAATSSSTKTKFSKDAQNYFESLSNANELKAYIKENNLSLFFEYTAPKNQIVIPYQKEEYTLIGARHNDIEDTNILRLDAQSLSLKSVKPQEMTLDELIDYQRTNETTEGFVVENEFGKLIKFKTDYWFQQHQEMGSLFFGSEYTDAKLDTLINLIKNDTIDDYVAYDNQRMNTFHPVADFKAAWDAKLDDYEKSIKAHSHLSNREIGPMEMDSTLKSLIFAERKGEDLMNNSILCKKIAREIRDELTAEALVNEYITDKITNEILADMEKEQKEIIR